MEAFSDKVWYVWYKNNSYASPIEHHTHSEARWWYHFLGCFSLAETGALVKVEVITALYTCRF